MRVILTAGGIQTFIGSHEWEFIETVFSDKEKEYKKNLDERQIEIADILTSRGILCRYQDDDNKIYYTRNKNKNV